MKTSSLIILLCFFLPVATITAQEPLSMDALLEEVRQGRAVDAIDNKKREAAFKAEKDQQQAKIEQAKAEVLALEARSAELEKIFTANELLVAEKRQQRDKHLGALKELFGHLTGVVGDLRSRLRNSITTSQFPDRTKLLSDLIKKMNSETDLPSLEEIEQVWFEMHREMTESAKVVKYTTTVGTEQNREIVRIGLFNLIADGEYLVYDAETQTVSVLPRQPANLAKQARLLQQVGDGVYPIGIDPSGATGGGFLKAIINTPTLTERWHQGRQIGYIISALGLLALLIGLWRFIVLTMLAGKMRVQLKREAIQADNPLGRLLLVAQGCKSSNSENLEMKLSEAILKEYANIQTGLALLKIVAMVAPLLGLLGTVTGMIIVFQAITIYGAGDTQAMAGGISNALVTTALGLVVAIPILLIHSMLASKAKKILHLLEQQSAGIIVQRFGK